MPASSQLNYWIAESGSWQSFIDFHLPEDAMAKYTFYPQYDDFYLSLMSRTIELLGAFNNGDEQVDSEELLSVAKGLEIFSLEEKKKFFNGIDNSNNVLFASGLYYLSNYSASAWILANIYPSNSYSEIDLFISNFLKRSLEPNENDYDSLLLRYLETGERQFLRTLIKLVNTLKNDAFDEDIDKYYSFVLADTLLLKFAKDNIWNDLMEQNSSRDYWESYVKQSINKSVPIWSFFPSQKRAIEKGLLSGKTSSLQMPTSSGKTSISELVVYEEFQRNADCKILYLAPFRALASELKQSLATNVGKLGIKSKTIYGGNIPTVEERNSISDVNLLIATPEKFLAIEDVFPGIYRQFTTIICDEGHLLDDRARGLSYELLLSRLKEEINQNRRFLFISATIPNLSDVNDWLGGTEETLVVSSYRPTKLEYAFLRKMKSAKSGYYLDVNPFEEKPNNYQLYKYLFGEDLKKLNPKTEKRTKITSKKGLSVAAALKATESGAVALFVPHKRGHSGVEGLAEETIYQLKFNKNFTLLEHSPPGYLTSLTEYFSIVFGEDYLLTKCSKFGVLFHHGDFPQSIREIIEDALRKDKVRLAICTNTLAEGVNLPIKTIVIHSTKRYNPASKKYNPNASGWEQIEIRDLKNLVGRAGRAGKETKGLIIVPHSTDFHSVRDLFSEQNVKKVKGPLFNIVRTINTFIKANRLKISTEILDKLNEDFQELLDGIDVAMIDLLSEEIEVEKLNEIVGELVNRTFSFYQANEAQKETLSRIFELRTEKLLPIIQDGKFKALRNSGTNIRIYNQIEDHFDFDDDVWKQNESPLNEDWLDYILDEGIFKLERFERDLSSFNSVNNCRLQNVDIKTAIQMWMDGNWFNSIKLKLSLETYQVLRLINNLVGYNIVSLISAVIRIKEINSEDVRLPKATTNWTSLLQRGLSSQLELDLTELGLTDRIAVLALAEHLDVKESSDMDYKELRAYLIENQDQLLENLENSLPLISVEKTELFFENLGSKNIL